MPLVTISKSKSAPARRYRPFTVEQHTGPVNLRLRQGSAPACGGEVYEPVGGPRATAGHQSKQRMASSRCRPSSLQYAVSLPGESAPPSDAAGAADLAGTEFAW